MEKIISLKELKIESNNLTENEYYIICKRIKDELNSLGIDKDYYSFRGIINIDKYHLLVIESLIDFINDDYLLWGFDNDNLFNEYAIDSDTKELLKEYRINKPIELEDLFKDINKKLNIENMSSIDVCEPARPKYTPFTVNFNNLDGNYIATYRDILMKTTEILDIKVDDIKLKTIAIGNNYTLYELEFNNCPLRNKIYSKWIEGNNILLPLFKLTANYLKDLGPVSLVNVDIAEIEARAKRICKNINSTDPHYSLLTNNDFKTIYTIIEEYLINHYSYKKEDFSIKTIRRGSKYGFIRLRGKIYDELKYWVFTVSFLRPYSSYPDYIKGEIDEDYYRSIPERINFKKNNNKSSDNNTNNSSQGNNSNNGLSNLSTNEFKSLVDGIVNKLDNKYSEINIKNGDVILSEALKGELYYHLFMVPTRGYDLDNGDLHFLYNGKELKPRSEVDDKELEEVITDLSKSTELDLDYPLINGIKREIESGAFSEPREVEGTDGFEMQLDNAYLNLLKELTKEDEKEANSLVNTMKKLQSARLELTSIVKGQDAAIDRFLSGLFDIYAFNNKDNMVKGSFLFAGPSGTGKTLLAKAISKTLNMDMLLVNLSEYSDKDAISRFRGFDKTFKNSRPGLVTSYIDKHPNTVIIFDEVDKADNSIKNILLQLYNDGYINDPQLEKNVSFKNTILIYTTNAGSKLYEETEGDLSTLSNKKIINALKEEINPKGESLFPSSLLSRFSAGGIVVFNNLEPYTLYEITKDGFDKKAKAFENNKLSKITYDDDLITALIYKLGGNADGRNLVGLCDKYIEDETINALRQLDEAKLAEIKNIKFSIDKTNNEEYFGNKKSNILVFMEENKYNSINTNIDGINFYQVSDINKAKELLKKDIDLIIVDLLANIRENNVYTDIEDVESDGRDLISYCIKYNNELPIYVLNENRNDTEFSSLYKLGIKGLIRFNEDFDNDCILARSKASMAKNCYSLNRANKILEYRTRQKLYDDTIEIEMYNLKFVTNFNASDDDFLLDVDRPDVKFSDIIGANDAKETLRDFIKYLNNPIAYLENGVRAPRGILLYGPPGTGKTMLAKALAGESTVSFIHKNASDFVNKSPDEIAKLFNRARKYAPAIIFLDEVDAIAKERMGFSTNESVLNKLLSELDGFKFDVKRPIIVVAATNFPIEKNSPNSVILDKAFVRRFDRKIKVDLPNKDERIEFINYYLNKHNIDTISNNCITNIANRTIYYSPADLEQLIEHAIRNTLGMKLTDDILSNTVDENKHGKSNKRSDEDTKRTAIHESGHALVSYLSGEIPAYLTIISRGDFGGYMAYSDDASHSSYTKDELLARIRIALAGRAAEIIEYGNELGLTTGPQADLFTATSLAKALITDYGMNNSLVCLSALGGFKDINIIPEINEILNKEFENAKKLILDNKEKYDNLVNALLERNSLTEDEIIEVLK